MKQIIIDETSSGKKLFRFLQQRILTEMRNCDIFRVIRQGKIKVNGKKKPNDYILAAGDEIRIYLPDDLIQTKNVKPKYEGVSTRLDILYEDERIIVINKPAEMPVHATNNDHRHNLTDMVRAYLYKNSPYGLLFEASPCHRLDTNTTGVLIFAKTQEDLNRITTIFRDRSCRKIYNAIVFGNIEDAIVICSEIDTSENARNKVTVSNLSVRSDIPADYSGCITAVQPLTHYDNVTFCEIELLTGKKHQIRAHLQAIGHPLVGDQKYFTAKSQKISDEHGIRTYMLHCARIELPEYGEFIAPLPNWSM